MPVTCCEGSSSRSLRTTGVTSLCAALSRDNQRQHYKTSIRWSWPNSGDAEKAGSSVPWRDAERCIYMRMKYFSVHCSVRLHHVQLGMNTHIRKLRKRGLRNSWGDQDNWMLNRENAKTEITTMCQCWKAAMGPLKVNEPDTSPNQNNREVHLWFNWQTLRDRNTQPVPLTVAAGAGCLVLVFNRSGLPNLMSLFHRVMNQNKQTKWKPKEANKSKPTNKKTPPQPTTASHAKPLVQLIDSLLMKTDLYQATSWKRPNSLALTHGAHTLS